MYNLWEKIMIKLEFKKKNENYDDKEYRIRFIIRAVKEDKMSEESFKPNIEKVLDKPIPTRLVTQFMRLIRDEPEESCYDYVKSVIKEI